MDRVTGWLAGAVLLLLLITFDQAHALRQLKNMYADEMKVSSTFERHASDLEEKVAELENGLDQCQIRNDFAALQADARLQGTTDLLESVARCAFFKLQPKHCIGKLDLKQVIEDNRSHNF